MEVEINPNNLHEKEILKYFLNSLPDEYLFYSENVNFPIFAENKINYVEKFYYINEKIIYIRHYLRLYKIEIVSIQNIKEAGITLLIEKKLKKFIRKQKIKEILK